LRHFWHKSGAPALLKQARRLVIFVIGSTIIALGVIMLITPGPAFIVIPAGLAILATEFIWARRLLKRVRKQVRVSYASANQRMGRGKSVPSAPTRPPEKAPPPEEKP